MNENIYSSRDYSATVFSHLDMIIHLAFSEIEIEKKEKKSQKITMQAAAFNTLEPKTRRMRFVCEECGRKFATKFSLNRHNEAFHGGDDSDSSHDMSGENAQFTKAHRRSAGTSTIHSF